MYVTTFFLLIHRFHNFFSPFLTIALPKQIFFFPFSVMTLPQLLFFNCTDSILDREISITVMPKFLYFLSPPFSFSLSSFLLNFGNTVTEIPLPKIRPGQLRKSNCGNVIAEKGKKKKICFGNCGNAIADNVKKKKILFWQLWQSHCWKWKKKKIMKSVNE